MKKTQGHLSPSEPHELLQTKFILPRPGSTIISREHLLSRLDEGLARKLTLVSAPAGFGKTTLISQWLMTDAWASSWVALDGRDNDPVRFWRYLIAACQRLDAVLGETAIAQLLQPKQPDFETLLITLINDLTKLSEKRVLVLTFGASL